MRTYGWENLVGTTLADIRYATRRLANSPGFTVVAVVTLALGIGASAAIFSTVNPILFAALPYPQASRVVMVSDIGADGSPVDVTFGTYVELAARTHSFSELAVANALAAGPDRIGRSRAGATAGPAESAWTTSVRWAFRQRSGAISRPAEDQVGGPRVAIVSDRLARRRGRVTAAGSLDRRSCSMAIRTR